MTLSKGDIEQALTARLVDLVSNYKSCILVTLDHVGSSHLQTIRVKLRGEAKIMVGKNSKIRYVLRKIVADYPDYEPLIPLLKGNLALVFTNSDLKEIGTKLTEDRVVAPTKSGSISPCDVYIPSGPTGMDAVKTGLFQNLNIPTKIVKSVIEVVTRFLLVKTGHRINASEANMINMLGLSPFTYGLNLFHIVSEGSSFSPAMLDLDQDTIVAKMREAINNVAAISLAIDVPTIASIPHSFVNGFKNVLAIALATEITFPLADAMLERIKNPTTVVPVAEPVAEAEPAAAQVVEESESEDGGFDLFD